MKKTVSVFMLLAMVICLCGALAFSASAGEDLNLDQYNVDFINGQHVSLSPTPVDADTALQIAAGKISGEDAEVTTVLYKTSLEEERFSCVSFDDREGKWMTQRKTLTLDEVQEILGMDEISVKFAVIGTANLPSPEPENDPEDGGQPDGDVAPDPEKKSPVAWIAVLSAAVVLAGAYVGGFFLFEKGKLTASFFRKIYSPMEKLLKKSVPADTQ